MTTALSTFSSLLLDVLIAAAALVVIYRAARYLAGLAETRWSHHLPEADPAVTEVWHVLAEARRITEQGARDATE